MSLTVLSFELFAGDPRLLPKGQPLPPSTTEIHADDDGNAAIFLRYRCRGSTGVHTTLLSMLRPGSDQELPAGGREITITDASTPMVSEDTFGLNHLRAGSYEFILRTSDGALLDRLPFSVRGRDSVPTDAG